MARADGDLRMEGVSNGVGTLLVGVVTMDSGDRARTARRAAGLINSEVEPGDMAGESLSEPLPAAAAAVMSGDEPPMVGVLMPKVLGSAEVSGA
jgi:hypothetical protein